MHWYFPAVPDGTGGTPRLPSECTREGCHDAQDKLPAGSPAFWPLEAEPVELQEYVTARIHGQGPEYLAYDEVQIEPVWFREAWDALWPQIHAEAGAW
jgi:hypothetical protein